MTKKAEDENKFHLNVTKRDIFGKKLKKTRLQGFLPGNIFGEDFKSQAVSIAVKDFLQIYKKARETHLVYLKLGSDEIPVLIQNLQKHPVTNNLLHVDFRKVNLAKKIETTVPIKLLGESEAVIQNKGILLTLAESIVIEALPDKIPGSIEIDISQLKELNDEVKVGDLTVSSDFTFKDDPGKPIVRITEHKEEEVTPQVAAPETVEVTEEKKEKTGEEAEPAKEEKKEEAKNEKTPKDKPEPKEKTVADENKK